MRSRLAGIKLLPQNNLIVAANSYTETFWIQNQTLRYFLVAKIAVPNLIKNLTTTKDSHTQTDLEFYQPPKCNCGEKKEKGGESAKTRSARFSRFPFFVALVVAPVAAIFTLYLFTFLLCALAHEFKYLPVAPCWETVTETEVQQHLCSTSFAYGCAHGKTLCLKICILKIFYDYKDA